METKTVLQTILLLCIYHGIRENMSFVFLYTAPTRRATTAGGIPDISTPANDRIKPPATQPSQPQQSQNIPDSSKRNAPSRRQQEANAAHAAYDRPPLEAIVTTNNTIIGDPEWLVNFGILGFGKCGTSTMMVWLREHPEVQAFGKELSDLMRWKPGRLVRRFYEELEAGPFIRGYKAPQDVSQPHILDFYRQYWPQAKIIIGIRHPISWFESLYNFRVQNLPAHQTLPHPNKLIGGCQKGKYGTCTDKGNFGFQLLKMGFQNYPHPRLANDVEKRIVERYPRSKMNITTFEPMTNSVFLFELEQLSDANLTRSERFRQDVTNFMGLQEMLPSLPHKIPGQKHVDEEQKRRDGLKINICDDEYERVRADLMQMSVTTSLWLRQVFLHHPNVLVSSPDYFNEIMQRWGIDPCIAKQ